MLPSIFCTKTPATADDFCTGSGSCLAWSIHVLVPGPCGRILVFLRARGWVAMIDWKLVCTAVNRLYLAGLFCTLLLPG